MKNVDLKNFLACLDRKIEWWRTNPDRDTHNIGNAVIACLSEIKGALELSQTKSTSIDSPDSSPANHTNAPLVLNNNAKRAYMQALIYQRHTCGLIELCPGSPQQTEISISANRTAFLLQGICMQFWNDTDPITSEPYVKSLGSAGMPVDFKA